MLLVGPHSQDLHSPGFPGNPGGFEESLSSRDLIDFVSTSLLDWRSLFV